jgi:hypothetical protein
MSTINEYFRDGVQPGLDQGLLDNRERSHDHILIDARRGLLCQLCSYPFGTGASSQWIPDRAPDVRSMAAML